MRSEAERMCLSKRGYWSMTEAVTVATRRVRKGAPALRAYQCPRCHRFHLTKKVVSERH